MRHTSSRVGCVFHSLDSATTSMSNLRDREKKKSSSARKRWFNTSELLQININMNILKDRALPRAHLGNAVSVGAVNSDEKLSLAGHDGRNYTLNTV